MCAFSHIFHVASRVCKSSDDLRKEETCAACFLVDCDDSDEMVQCDGVYCLFSSHLQILPKQLNNVVSRRLQCMGAR